MIYQAHDAAVRGTRPLFRLFDVAHKLARDSRNPVRDASTMRALAAIWELQARNLREYGKPRYFDDEQRLEERVALNLPFADLLNFAAPDSAGKPKVLIAAALVASPIPCAASRCLCLRLAVSSVSRSWIRARRFQKMNEPPSAAHAAPMMGRNSYIGSTMSG